MESAGSHTEDGSDHPHHAQDAALFRKFDDYPWIKDKQFLQGLAATLGPLLPSTDMARAATVSRQARIWWFLSRQRLAVDPSAYDAYVTSDPSAQPPDAALLARIEDIQRRMNGITTGTNTGGGGLPAWQAHAPRADLAVKAGDGAAVATTAAARAVEGSGDEAPYPEHFKAIIEAITQGKPVPGIKEIPDTVVRPAGITPVGKMAAPRKPWERGQSDGGRTDGTPANSSDGREAANVSASALPQNLLDEEFPELLEGEE